MVSYSYRKGISFDQIFCCFFLSAGWMVHYQNPVHIHLTSHSICEFMLTSGSGLSVFFDERQETFKSGKSRQWTSRKFFTTDHCPKLFLDLGNNRWQDNLNLRSNCLLALELSVTLHGLYEPTVMLRTPTFPWQLCICCIKTVWYGQNALGQKKQVDLELRTFIHDYLLQWISMGFMFTSVCNRAAQTLWSFGQEVMKSEPKRVWTRVWLFLYNIIIINLCVYLQYLRRLTRHDWHMQLKWSIATQKHRLIPMMQLERIFHSASQEDNFSKYQNSSHAE